MKRRCSSPKSVIVTCTPFCLIFHLGNLASQYPTLQEEDWSLKGEHNSVIDSLNFHLFSNRILNQF